MGYYDEYQKMQEKATTEIERLNKLLEEKDKKIEKYRDVASCLDEAIDLMEDVELGGYTPDSFTTQPWRIARNRLEE
jgi:hypothetical protein